MVEYWVLLLTPKAFSELKKIFKIKIKDVLAPRNKFLLISFLSGRKIY